MRIAVLGRGISLRRYTDCNSLFDKIYIVNNFTQEVRLIGLEKFSGEVVHIVGEGKNNLPADMYKSLGISSVQSNNFCNFRSKKRFKKSGVKVLNLPTSMLKRGYPYGTSWKDTIKHTAILSYAEIVSRFKGSGKMGRGWPTTGLLAIDFALCSDDPDELYLFGFDLYAKDYLVKKKEKHHSRKSPKSKMMFFHLKYLVEEFKRCKFFCASKLDIDFPNWNNL